MAITSSDILKAMFELRACMLCGARGFEYQG